MDRKRLLKALKYCLMGCGEEGCEYNEKAICNGIECKTCAEVLLDDVLEEMKIGKWVIGGKYRDTYKCSECGISVITHKAMEWEYCPRCGAYMSGVVRDEIHQTERPAVERTKGTGPDREEAEKRLREKAGWEIEHTNWDNEMRNG